MTLELISTEFLREVERHPGMFSGRSEFNR